MTADALKAALREVEEALHGCHGIVVSGEPREVEAATQAVQAMLTVSHAKVQAAARKLARVFADFCIHEMPRSGQEAVEATVDAILGGGDERDE